MRLMAELLQCQALPYELVTRKLNVAGSTIKGLEEKGVIQVVADRVYRNPLLPEAGLQEKKNSVKNRPTLCRKF